MIGENGENPRYVRACNSIQLVVVCFACLRAPRLMMAFRSANLAAETANCCCSVCMMNAVTYAKSLLSPRQGTNTPPLTARLQALDLMAFWNTRILLEACRHSNCTLAG